MNEKIIKLIFRLYSGKYIQIQTDKAALISIADEVDEINFDETDQVFRVE